MYNYERQNPETKAIETIGIIGMEDMDARNKYTDYDYNDMMIYINTGTTGSKIESVIDEREIEIVDHSVEIIKYDERKVDSSNPKHIGSPIPGNVVKIFVKAGDAVEANKPIMTIEAMKMETTVLSKSNGVISEILVKEGDRVSDNQLIATLE